MQLLTSLLLMSGEMAAFLGGGLCFALFFAWLAVTSIIDANRRRRKVGEYKSIAVVPIEELADQQVARIVGLAKAADAVLEAPVSGRTCLAYQATIYQRSLDGKHWHAVGSEARYVRSFLLVGEREEAVVEPVQPRVLFNPDAHTHSGTFADPSARERAFADRIGAKTKSWVFNKNLMYREAVIEVDQEVEVYGKCLLVSAAAPAAESGYRSGNWSRRIVAPEDGPMFILDGPEAVNLLNNPEYASQTLPTSSQ